MDEWERSNRGEADFWPRPTASQLPVQWLWVACIARCLVHPPEIFDLTLGLPPELAALAGLEVRCRRRGALEGVCHNWRQSARRNTFRTINLAGDRGRQALERALKVHVYREGMIPDPSYQATSPCSPFPPSRRGNYFSFDSRSSQTLVYRVLPGTRSRWQLCRR